MRKTDYSSPGTTGDREMGCRRVLGSDCSWESGSAVPSERSCATLSQGAGLLCVLSLVKWWHVHIFLSRIT